MKLRKMKAYVTVLLLSQVTRANLFENTDPLFSSGAPNVTVSEGTRFSAGLANNIVNGMFVENPMHSFDQACTTTDKPPGTVKNVLTITMAFSNYIRMVYLGGSQPPTDGSDYVDLSGSSTPTDNVLYTSYYTENLYLCTKADNTLYWGFYVCPGARVTGIVLQLSSKISLCEIRASGLSDVTQYSADITQIGTIISGSLSSLMQRYPLGYGPQTSDEPFLHIQGTTIELQFLVATSFTLARIWIILEPLTTIPEGSVKRVYAQTANGEIDCTMNDSDFFAFNDAFCPQIAVNPDDQIILSLTAPTAIDIKVHGVALLSENNHLYPSSVLNDCADFPPYSTSAENTPTSYTSSITIAPLSNMLSYYYLYIDPYPTAWMPCQLTRNLQLTDQSGGPPPDFIGLQIWGGVPQSLLQIRIGDWASAGQTTSFKVTANDSLSPTNVNFSVELPDLNTICETGVQLPSPPPSPPPLYVMIGWPPQLLEELTNSIIMQPGFCQNSTLIAGLQDAYGAQVTDITPSSPNLSTAFTILKAVGSIALQGSSNDFKLAEMQFNVEITFGKMDLNGDFLANDFVIFNRQVTFLDCRPILTADKTTVVVEIGKTDAITITATHPAACIAEYLPDLPPMIIIQATFPVGLPAVQAGNVITIAPVSQSQIGIKNFQVDATLEGFVYKLDVPLALSVEIRTCTALTSLQPPYINNAIDVSVGVETIIPIANLQTPDCALQLTNTLVAAANQVPSYVSVIAGNMLRIAPNKKTSLGSSDGFNLVSKALDANSIELSATWPVKLNLIVSTCNFGDFKVDDEDIYSDPDGNNVYDVQAGWEYELSVTTTQTPSGCGTVAYQLLKKPILVSFDADKGIATVSPPKEAVNWKGLLTFQLMNGSIELATYDLWILVVPETTVDQKGDEKEESDEEAVFKPLGFNGVVFSEPLEDEVNFNVDEEWEYTLPDPMYLLPENELDAANIKITAQVPTFITFDSGSKTFKTNRPLKKADNNKKLQISLSEPNGLKAGFSIKFHLIEATETTKDDASDDCKDDEECEDNDEDGDEDDCKDDEECEDDNEDGDEDDCEDDEECEDDDDNKDDKTDEISSTVADKKEEAKPLKPSEDPAKIAAVLEQQLKVDQKLSETNSWEGFKNLMQQASLDIKTAQGMKASAPTVALSSSGFSQLGIMQIGSSVPINVPKTESGRRALQENLQKSIKATLLRGGGAVSENTNSTDIDITWNITGFTENGVEINFQFSDPKQVSTSDESDVIIIQILDISAFAGQNGQLPSTLFIATQMPRQMIPNGTEATVAESSDDAGDSAQTIVAGNFVMNMVLSASLNQLWSMVEAQQIVVMMPMFFISTPALPGAVVQKFLDIANFDFLPVGDMYAGIFYMPPNYPLEDRYVACSMEDNLFVGNMGTLFVIFLLIFLAMVLYGLLSFCEHKHKKIKQCRKCLNRNLFWAFPLQTFMESCMVIALCAILTIQNPNKESLGQRIDTALSYILGISGLILMFVIPILMHRGRTKLDEKYSNHSKRFWVLYEDLDLENPWIPFYRFVYMLRRVIIAIAIAVVRHLVFQIMLAFFQSTLMIITVGWLRPFEDSSRNNKELANEMIILSSIYFIMCFSELVPEPWVQDLVGYGFCLLMTIHCVIHLGIMLGSMVLEALSQYRRNRQIQKHLKLAKEKLAKNKQKTKQLAKDYMERRLEYVSDDEQNFEELDELIKNELAVYEDGLEEIKEEEDEEYEQNVPHNAVLVIQEEEKEQLQDKAQAFAVGEIDAWNGYKEDERHDSWEDDPENNWQSLENKKAMHIRNESQRQLLANNAQTEDNNTLEKVEISMDGLSDHDLEVLEKAKCWNFQPQLNAADGADAYLNNLELLDPIASGIAAVQDSPLANVANTETVKTEVAKTGLVKSSEVIVDAPTDFDQAKPKQQWGLQTRVAMALANKRKSKIANLSRFI